MKTEANVDAVYAKADRLLDSNDSSDDVRARVFNKGYTKSGKRTYDVHDDLYLNNPIPPLKVLNTQSTQPYQLVHSNDTFDVHFWEACEFSTFHRVLKEMLNIDDTSVLWFTKVYRTKKLEKVQYVDDRQDMPSLASFMQERDTVTFRVIEQKKRKHSAVEMLAKAVRR